MNEFRWGIGELVVAKSALAEAMTAARHGQFSAPRVGIVLEHLTFTCYGGTQRFYSVSFGGDVKRLAAIELADPSELDIAAQIRDHDAFHERVRAAEDEMYRRRAEARAKPKQEKETGASG